MRKLIFAAIILLVGATTVKAEEGDRPLHEIHSMMVFNFIKYVNWPTSGETFKIGVVGSTEVYNTLSQWYNGKMVGSSKLVIEKIDPSNVSGYQVVYVAKGASKHFDTIQKSLKGQPTLTITDKEGLGEKGSSINFKEVGGKLRFEINLTTFNQSNLKVSSQLAGMAIMI